MCLQAPPFEPTHDHAAEAAVLATFDNVRGEGGLLTHLTEIIQDVCADGLQQASSGIMDLAVQALQNLVASSTIDGAAFTDWDMHSDSDDDDQDSISGLEEEFAAVFLEDDGDGDEENDENGIQ